MSAPSRFKRETVAPSRLKRDAFARSAKVSN